MSFPRFTGQTQRVLAGIAQTRWTREHPAPRYVAETEYAAIVAAGQASGWTFRDLGKRWGWSSMRQIKAVVELVEAYQVAPDSAETRKRKARKTSDQQHQHDGERKRAPEPAEADKAPAPAPVEVLEGAAPVEPSPVLLGDVEDLDWRVVEVLVRHGMTTLADVEAKTSAELLALSGFGRGSLAKVRATLARRGLVLTADAPRTKAHPVDDEQLQKAWAFMTRRRLQVVEFTEGRAEKLAAIRARFGEDGLRDYCRWCDSDLRLAVFLRDTADVNALLRISNVQDRLDQLKDGPKVQRVGARAGAKQSKVSRYVAYATEPEHAEGYSPDPDAVVLDAVAS